MKIKLSSFVALCVFFASTFAVSSAKADDTYAVLDSSGNVTNIIVCGSACAGGSFGGQTVVPQVAADPVTGQNRGGFWQGPDTTTYDSDTKNFIVNDPTPVINSETVLDSNGDSIELSTTVYGSAYSFNYEDTKKSDMYSSFKPTAPKDNTAATISAKNKNLSQSLSFIKRATANEIKDSALRSSYNLVVNNLNRILALLGNWTKP